MPRNNFLKLVPNMRNFYSHTYSPKNIFLNLVPNATIGSISISPMVGSRDITISDNQHPTNLKLFFKPLVPTRNKELQTIGSNFQHNNFTSVSYKPSEWW